jgi:hypothetical protein
MSDLDWARGRANELLAPDFDRPRCWKERPIDVRAEALAQVGPKRRAEIRARRIEDSRDQKAEAEANCRLAPPHEAEPIREPEIRRRRRRDPYYPSSWYRWRGDKGRAYISAWTNYSWGLSPRPKPWREFSEAPPRKHRLRKSAGRE